MGLLLFAGQPSAAPDDLREAFGEARWRFVVSCAMAAVLRSLGIASEAPALEAFVAAGLATLKTRSQFCSHKDKHLKSASAG